MLNELEIPFFNAEDETIPGYAVMTCVGTQSTGDWQQTPNLDGRFVLNMGKPRDFFDRFYYVNGPIAVPPGGYGTCSTGMNTAALWNDNSAPAVGHGVGPKPGDWGLWRRQPGFTVVAGFSNDLNDQPGGRIVQVRQYEVTHYIARTPNGIAAGGADQVELWPTNLDRPFKVVAAGQLLAAGEEIEADRDVVIQWVIDNWVVVGVAPLVLHQPPPGSGQ